MALIRDTIAHLFRYRLQRRRKEISEDAKDGEISEDTKDGEISEDAKDGGIANWQYIIWRRKW